jgi:hypothetical protein
MIRTWIFNAAWVACTEEKCLRWKDCEGRGGVFIFQKRGNLKSYILPIQLPYIQEEGKNMSQEEGKTKNLLWWAGLIALLILVIVGGL